MAFWKRDDKKRKRELEGIKNRVEGKEPEIKPLPPPPPLEKTDTSISQPTLPEPSPPSPPPKKASIVGESKESAPLFIKIEKYEEVIQKLEELKNNLKALTRLLSFHKEIEELREDVFTRIKDTTSSITNILISMDEIFVKPERPEITGAKEKKEERTIEEEILDLGEELRHLKKELSEIE